MAFEKTVLNLVADVLQEKRRASFTNGCLFVDCNEYQARRVFHELSDNFGLGQVQVHGPIQGEYAFDFVPAPEEIYSPYLGAI
jgi:hypothetical protein